MKPEQSGIVTTSEKNTIVPINKEKVKTQIYEIRGYRVMLDADIAGYFGVTTGNLNKAMKRNIKRFPDNFCFQMTKDEYLSFQFGISNDFETKNRGGRRYMPYVYTEQGVAMLSSVLHTNQAIDASVFIMEAFVEMAHYIQQNQQLLPYQELYTLSARQDKLESEVKEIKDTMVTRADLSDFLKLFDNGRESEEILILNGEPFKADAAYQQIYKKAKKNIILIDDYIGVKTLQHLAHTRDNTDITIISDNKGRKLRLSEYIDFQTEYPGKNITFLISSARVHDRYIVLDYGTNDMKVYLCGSSSKDSGNRITTIIQIQDISEYRPLISSLLSNPVLTLI